MKIIRPFNRFNFLSVLLLIAITFAACSDKESYMTGKYWVKYKKNKPQTLVKFAEDGQFIRYDKLHLNQTYSFNRNRLIIADDSGKDEHYLIETLTPEELKISRVSELNEEKVIIYRIAREEDKFLGQWQGKKDDIDVKIDFSPEEKLKYEEMVEGWEFEKDKKYIVKLNNTIIINNEVSQYSFSDDMLSLEIISASGIVYKLTRKQ